MCRLTQGIAKVVREQPMIIILLSWLDHACAGTPVQNNMRELWGIMSLLDPDNFGDEAQFEEQYGGDDEPPTVAQIQDLQV